MVGMLPVLGFQGFKATKREGMADDLAQCLKRVNIAERERLNEDVSRGRRFDWTGDDLPLRGTGRELIEEAALAASPDDMQSGE